LSGFQLVPVLRRYAALAVAFAVLGAAYLAIGMFDGLGSLQGDGLIYVVTARHYAPYWPGDEVGAIYARITQFPPVYPALLAATGGAVDFLVAHTVTTVTLLTAWIAFYGWLIALGLGPGRATLGVVLLALMPGTFQQVFYLHPEGLYVTLVFLALALLLRAEGRAGSRDYWMAAAAISVALVTRSVGITLLPALLLVLARNRPRGWPAMLALAVAPAVAWALVHHPPFSYGDVLRENYGEASLAQMAAAVAGATAVTLEGLVANVTELARLHGVVAALGVIALVVAIARGLRGQPDAWYVAAYLGVMALWPYPQEAVRLTWVIVPVLLGYLLIGGQWLATRLSAQGLAVRSMVAATPALMLAVAILPGAALTAARAVHPLTRDTPALRHLPEWYRGDPVVSQWLAEVHLGTVEGLRQMADLVPEGECVYATAPLLTTFYSGHGAMIPPLESVDDAAFAEALSRAPCRFFVLTLMPGRGFTASFYPGERIRARVEIVAEHSIGVGPPDQRRVTALAVLQPAMQGLREDRLSDSGVGRGGVGE
jgi:hypothetical protein